MYLALHPTKGHLLTIQAGFNKTLISACRTIPGMFFDRGCGAWAGYPDAVDQTVRLLERETGIRVSGIKLLAKAGDGIDPILFAKADLRKHQVPAVDFILRHGHSGAILGDEMGLGKTVSALVAARALGVKTLVVCPNFARGVWTSHAEKWWPRGFKNMALPRGTTIKQTKDPAAFPGADTKLIVIHYDILHAWADAIRAWGPVLVLLDEFHQVIEPSSRRAKAVREVCSGANMRVALTGTPLPIRIREFWNMVDTLSPGRFGLKFWDFGMRYCAGHQETIEAIGKSVWNFDGASNEVELHDRLKWLMLRRTLDESGLELPPKTRQVIWLDSAKKARRSSSILIKNKAALRAALDLAADQKMPQALDYVRNAAQGSSVVVFCYRRAVAEYFARETGGAFIHGGIPVSRRDKILTESRLRKNGVLAVTIDSCGVAIDMTFATMACFVELTYDPNELLQAEKRVHRPGQKRPVLISYLLGRGSTDELINQVVISRFRQDQAVVGKTGEKLDSSLGGAEMTTDAILAEIFAGVGGKG